MARQRAGKPSPPNSAELHRSWLELVDVEGPFLAIPPLKRVWPNGIPDFRSIHPDRFTALADARKEFETAWEQVDRHPDDDTVLASYRNARDEWVQTVLRDVIGWQDSLMWGDVSAIQAQSPSHTITINPQAVLTDRGGGNAALVYVIDPVESLRETPNDGWAATPVDRLEELLRVADVPIGIVTDGRWWGLVSARTGSMPASGVIDALTWIEEPRTRDAFLTILGRQYLIGGDPNERLPVLFEDSIAAAEEITEALGVQVRQAVELLVQAFAESAAEAKRRGQRDPLPERSHDVYEAAVTIMMRTVFLLFAEERGLLPTGELFEQGYGLSGELDRLAQREAEEGEEALDVTSLTWHRLLATSAAIYGGATFENLRMPAYGGSLFDAARFPMLTATDDDGTLAIAVSDRVMLHVLRSVQLAVLKGGEARRISFRDIDVEQIGYIYEGLLGYTTARVDETYVGLKGTTGAQPEIPLSTLEELRRANPDPKKFSAALRDWVTADQPAAKAQSAVAIVKGLGAETDPSEISALSQAVGGDVDLRDRIEPFLGIIRRDLRSHPHVVVSGGLLVKETPSRKNAGAHYTPKSLAEEVVLHALQPLCYSPGPHQTGDEAAWKLRPSEEILDLKVADIACGSGAFLVASARYLADRVVEAWIAEDPKNALRKDLHVRAIRQVVANCLYGADINEMAVEMAKLSLWLVSLDRDLPFSFVDDKIFLGNSLLGLTSLDQLRALHIDPASASGQDILSDVHVDVDAVIRRAIELRERLASEIDEDDPMRSTTAKRRQYEQFQAVTSELQQLADGMIAAGLPLGGKPGKGLDEAYQNLRQAVKQAQSVDAGGRGDASRLDAIIQQGLKPTVATDYERWKPLHWVLEAPDVMVDHGGFDAVVGNPPFLGFKKITPAVGKGIRDWYATFLGGGNAAKSDLVAFFLARAWQLTRGTLGLVTTNTVSEGDTREAGLERLVADGFEIARCLKSIPWPASTASLECAVLWGARELRAEVVRWADGIEGSHIGPMLTIADGGGSLPVALSENAGIVFQGCIPLGKGFVVSEDLAQQWIAQDPRNADVLLPFHNGESVNGTAHLRPKQWAIDFGERTRPEAETYELPWRHLYNTVRHERARNSSKRRREIWWQYAQPSTALRRTLSELGEVLVISIVSKHVMPIRVSVEAVLSNALDIWTDPSFAMTALMSSSPHQLWAMTYGSSLETRVRYVISDVFETFPRPPASIALEVLGQELHSRREEVMLDRNIGLTDLYNLVNDARLPSHQAPDVGDLRALHRELDTVVLDAYGWSDIDPGNGFFDLRGVVRWTVSPTARQEILDRLLLENRRRADSESAAGPRTRKTRKSNGATTQDERLFS